jgi:Repeat of unknown function (DUF346)
MRRLANRTRFCIMKHTYKRSLLSIAIAALMLVSLCAVDFSPLNVSAVDGSNTNVQATTFVGGQLASGTGPAACAQDANSLDVFVKGTDNALWYRHYQSGSWSSWKSLGGSLTSSPAAVSRSAGKIDVFVRGNDGALWTRATTNGGTSWSNWYKIGGQLAPNTGPAAYAWGDARIGWVVTGTNKALYHMWKDSAGTHSWQSLGGILTSSPAAMSPTSGVIDVYGRGNDGAIYQREYKNNAWSSWTSLGGQLASNTGPAACSWGPGRLDVFAQGTNGALYHKWYNGGWSGWESLGGALTSSPAAAAASGGNSIDVFVRGTDGALWWKYYNGGTIYYVPQAGSTWVNQGTAGASYDAFVSTPSLFQTQSNGYSYWGDIGKDNYIYIPAGSATNNQNVVSWEIGFHFAGIASGQRYQKIWDKAAGGFSIYIDTFYGADNSVLTIYHATTSGSKARWYIPTDTVLRTGHNYYIQISWDTSAGPGYEPYPTIWIGEDGNAPVHQMHWDETGGALGGTGSWYNDAVGGANLGNMASNNGINTSAKTSWLVGGIFVYRQYNSIIDFSSGGSWQTDKLRWT